MFSRANNLCAILPADGCSVISFRTFVQENESCPGDCARIKFKIQALDGDYSHLVSSRIHSHFGREREE